MKEVRYDIYCPKCNWKYSEDNDCPCCNCLQSPGLDNTIKPLYFDGDYKAPERIGMPKSFTKIKDFVYELEYDELDIQKALDYYRKNKVEPGIRFGCSSFNINGYFGSNYDWFYNNEADFIVRTKHAEKSSYITSDSLPSIGIRYSSVGIASSISRLTNNYTERNKDDDIFKIAAFQLVRGVNEKGVCASIHVVPLDEKNGTEFKATKVEYMKLPQLMLVRYIIDNFATATGAVEFIKNYVTLYPITGQYSYGYDCHFMVADADKTYVLEFIDGHTEVIDISEFPYMTNFRLYDTVITDGVVVTPDESIMGFNAHTVNNIELLGSGLERYNLIHSRMDNITTFETAKNLLYSLQYTNAYNVYLAKKWYSEFVGIDNLDVTSSISDFEKVFDKAVVLFNNRSRDTGNTWQTNHSFLYCRNDPGYVYCMFQEDGEYLKIKI